MFVRVLNRGYFGGAIREPGEKFDVPDEVMTGDRPPSWLEPVDGGSLDADDDAEDASSVVVEAGKAPTKPKGKPGRKPKADAKPAEPVQPAGNGVADELGGPAPDWLPPGADS